MKQLTAWKESDDLWINLHLQPGDWLDVAVLEQTAQPESLVEDLQRQVQVYRGELLPGFYDDWVLLERERLAGVYEARMSCLLDALLRRDRWSEAASAAEQWIARGRTPEPAYQALILASAARGSMAGAGAAYQRCQQALHQDVGVEPSPKTRLLYNELRQGAAPSKALVMLDLLEAECAPAVTLSAESGPSEQKAQPGRTSTLPPRSNLPLAISSLIGREQDIASICSNLKRAEIRLVTLVGPPGIGKTRLGLEVARSSLAEFPNGVFFVALAPLEEPSQIAPAILQALEYSDYNSLAAGQQLIDGIGNKQMLLVLDDCEHLIEDVSVLASELLSACAGLKLLATTREVLRIPGEWLYIVPSLALPEEAPVEWEKLARHPARYPALALFAERARAVRSDFQLDAGNIQAVVRMCSQLDGLPLAIELIAAWVRLMSPQALLERWNDQLILSAEGMRTSSTRQRTLQDAIGWSYNLLTEEEQQVFAHLAVFSGGFSLEAADSTLSEIFPETAIPNKIASLLDKSLLQRSVNPHGEPRFTLLVTIQQFALGRLRNMGKETQARDAHMAYFISLAERANGLIRGPDQLAWVDLLDRELDNFRAALEWSLSQGRTEITLRLLIALDWSWHIRCHYWEKYSWFETLKMLPDLNAYPALYARMLNQMGRSLWVLGDFPLARSLLEEARTIWLGLAEPGEPGLAENLDWLGMVIRVSEADYDTAEALFEQSLALYQKHENLLGMAETIFHSAHMPKVQNYDTLAIDRIARLEQSLELFEQLGDLWGKARVSQIMGDIHLLNRRYEQARRFYEQHYEIVKQLNFIQGLAAALHNLGDLYRYQGDLVQATEYILRGRAIGREYALRWVETTSNYFLGMIALQQDAYQQAEQYFKDYHDLNRDYEKTWSAVDLLFGLAAVASGIGRYERSARLYGAAQAILGSTNIPFPKFDLAEFERHIQLARRALDQTDFDALVSEGGAMTIEQAVAYAREE